MPDPTVALFRDAVAGRGRTPGLSAPGVAVLLVYGAQIRVARDGAPGIRVTAGYHDGTVLLEAVGFGFDARGSARHAHPAAHRAIHEAEVACLDAGLSVQAAPHRMSNFPARIVSRR